MVYTSYDPDQLPDAVSELELDLSEVEELVGEAFIVAHEVTVSAPAG